MLMICVKAQNLIPKDGDNIKNNDINKFIGTWKWEYEKETLIFILKKENILHSFGKNIREDMIIGFHDLSKNGQIIETSTQYSYTNYSLKNNKSTIYASTNKHNPNILSGSINHLSKNKTVNFEIEYLDYNKIKLKKIENRGGIKINTQGKPAYDWSISLPQNIILTRQ